MTNKSNLPAEITSILNKLNEEQLIQLNHRIIERLNLFSKAKQLNAMSQFGVGDKISFEANGRIITGTIIRLNQKTVSIITENKEKWNVAPSLIDGVVES